MATVTAYADYLKEPQALSLEQMAEIRRQMADGISARSKDYE